MITGRAFAKINLILKVFDKRPDNYHNIFSLIHKVSLHDIIKISANKKGDIDVECDVDLGISPEENIVFKAAIALQEYTKCNKPARIKIEKIIPTGAGLGGGSSDAATTLKLLNQFWNLKLGIKNLYEIATTLGSDVPFFLNDYPQWVYGRGEYCDVLDLIDMNKNNNFIRRHLAATGIIVYPKIHIDTSLAYKKLNRGIGTAITNNDTYLKNIVHYEELIERNQNIFLASNMLKNDFEEIIFEMYPEIADLHSCLSGLFKKRVRLTGSGSAIFMLFTDKNKYMTSNYAKTFLRRKFKEEGKDYQVFRVLLLP